MSSRVAIFYNRETRHITRIVKPDSDAGLQYHPPGPGEAIITMNRGFYDSMKNLREVAAYVGLRPGP